MWLLEQVVQLGSSTWRTEELKDVLPVPADRGRVVDLELKRGGLTTVPAGLTVGTLAQSGRHNEAASRRV